MGVIKDILEFISDKKKIHQIIFILPLVIFYLTNQPDWLLLVAVIILASMEVYKSDLEIKIKKIIIGRVNQKSKNKPFFRNWKDQLKDASKEFNYIYLWPLFGVISLVFIFEFAYSTYLSYDCNKILFGIHIFLIVYILFLQAIINHNFNLSFKNKPNKKKK